MGKSKLVIVESPAKARTIAGYLGPDFHVEASIGHIRDLPQPSELPADMKKGPYGKFAVNIEDGFTPYYVVDADKKKKVSELRALLRECDELYLATDEDREGEAIAWHLQEVLAPKVPTKRMVFHEITKEAITRALQATRELNTHLVDAQETRRILDRLVGYELSPLLWRKVRPGLSAGRVQSVATRLVVDRERERMGFQPAEYWDIHADLSLQPGAGESFTARSVAVGPYRLATGRDFADDGQFTAAAKKAGVRALDGQAVEAIGQALRGPAAAWTVSEIETKPYRRRPAAPFTTSTMQQEASRKLRMNSRDAMRVAQSLYENGYITYMRTDSVALSEQATRAAREQAAQLYGPGSVDAKPRVYATKSKGAQEAHEAIRPAGDHFRTPDQVAAALNPQQLALYTLIWKRTIASQMKDATGTTNTVKIMASVPGAAEQVPGWEMTGDLQVEFSAAGTVITERGFLAAYEEGRDAARYDDESEGGSRLPQLELGQNLVAGGVDTSAERQHFTTPPPRFTDASLVKALEERGIGRPSTYASTISVITDRGYVVRRGQALVPTWLAFSVTRLLEENLPELVDYDFTADMEADLDRIAAGEEDRAAWLEGFYHGAGKGSAVHDKGLQKLVEGLGDIDAQALNSVDLGAGIVLRVGRYGPYLQRGEERASVPEDLAPDELTVEKAEEILTSTPAGERELGVDPATGYPVVAKSGRFGPYVESGPVAQEGTAKRGAKKEKPKTASLFKSMSVDSVTLEQALQLLSQPRVIGTNAEGKEITAQNGKFGPYIKCGTDSRSLAEEEQIFSLTLEEALELLAQPKTRGRASTTLLREIGTDPVTEKPVTIKNGRFGPYITDGTTNVTVPRAHTVEDITPEQAYELLAEKRAKGPVKRASTKKATATKKTTAKKSTTSKKGVSKTTKAKAEES